MDNDDGRGKVVIDWAFPPNQLLLFSGMKSFLHHIHGYIVLITGLEFLAWLVRPWSYACMFPLSCHTQVASPPPPSPFPPFVSLHPTSPLPRFTLASHASRSPFPTPFGSCHCPFTACLTAARFETNNGASYLVLLPVGRGYERTTLQPSSTSTYPSVQILVVSLFSLPSLPLFSL